MEKALEPKIIKTIENLSCELNEVEWQNRARELAEAQEIFESEELRKKDVMKQLNYDISNAKNRVSKMASIVATRREQRDVTIEVKYDYELSTVIKTRTDTNAIISKRDMTTEEKQSGLFEAEAEENEA